MESLPIEYKFESERFQRFLHAHPHQAHEYAVSHFEDYLAILHEYRLLQTKHDQLQNELIKLHSRQSPQLPSFLSIKRK